MRCNHRFSKCFVACCICKCLVPCSRVTIGVRQNKFKRSLWILPLDLIFKMPITSWGVTFFPERQKTPLLWSNLIKITLDCRAKRVDYCRVKLDLEIKNIYRQMYKAWQEEKGNWSFALLFPLTIGGAHCQSNFNRRPHVFLTNQRICFWVLVGVPTRVDNRAAGTVIGNKLDDCRLLAMLARVSIGNTTSRLPHQVILKLW